MEPKAPNETPESTPSALHPKVAARSQDDSPTETRNGTQIASPNPLFARIRRQALIILGSVGGTLILAVQTYILHQQTDLIAKQTEALSLDQSAHIRERIVGASQEESRVKRLLQALQSAANLEIHAEALEGKITEEQLGGVVTIKDFVVEACLTPICSKAPLDATLREIGDHTPPNLDVDVARGILRLSVSLQYLDSKFSSSVEAPKEIDTEKKSDKLGPITELVATGITQCFFDPAKATDLSENMARLRLITSNGFWPIFSLTNPDGYGEMVAKFPQVGSNTKMGLIRLEDATAAVVQAKRDSASGSTGGAHNRSDFTIQDFVPVLAGDILAVTQGLSELDRQCKATLTQDAAALKSMASGAER